MSTQETPSERGTEAKAEPERTPAARTGATDGGDVVEKVGKAAAAATAAAEAVGARPEPFRAPSTNFTSELTNIPFKAMISGPLQAAVDAQVASSLATIDFVNKVGFTTPDGDGGDGKRELIMVDFSHTRKEIDAEGKEVSKDVQLKVPLLALLPIPSLRIQQVVIDFNVKLNSVESSEVSDSLGVNAEVKGGWGPVSFKVSASYQRKTVTNVEVKKEYSLAVNVTAVQDEMPAGLEKVLNMLAA